MREQAPKHDGGPIFVSENERGKTVSFASSDFTLDMIGGPLPTEEGEGTIDAIVVLYEDGCVKNRFLVSVCSVRGDPKREIHIQLWDPMTGEVEKDITVSHAKCEKGREH